MRAYLTVAVFAIGGLVADPANVLAQARNVGGGITAGTRTALSGSVAGTTTEGSTSSGQDAPGGAGQIGSSDRFLRENRGAGSFVGASAADAQEFVGGIQAGVGSNFRIQNIGSAGGRGGAGVNQPGQGGRGGRATTIRTSLHVAFTYPTMPSSNVSTVLLDRLVRVGKIRSTAGLKVEVQGDTATLRGMVATQHDREMAEQLVRLEAGIWTVNNELTIAQTPTESGASESGPLEPGPPKPLVPPSPRAAEKPAKPPAP